MKLNLKPLSDTFFIGNGIVYNLLKNKANQHQAVLELAKLKRENEALISIIGSLVAESKLGKKRNKCDSIMDYFLYSNQPQVSKSVACGKMLVSRGSIYYKPKLPAKDFALKSKIEAVMNEHKAYGHRRIAIALGVGRKKVLRVMKLFNLKPKKLRKKPRFKKSKFPKNSAKNLILDLAINQPNQVWVSDFTYLPYQNKFLYLATILDAFTREVIAWNIASRHNKELITATLLDAINKRERPPNIFHSDQGSEYRSDELANILTKQNIKASMSKKVLLGKMANKNLFIKNLNLSLKILTATTAKVNLLKQLQSKFITTTINESTVHLKCHQMFFTRDLYKKIS